MNLPIKTTIINTTHHKNLRNGFFSHFCNPLHPFFTIRFMIFPLAVFFLFSNCHAASVKMRKLVDQTGRKIEIPKNPKRVISLTPSITEIIYDINREDCLKGVTKYSDFPVQAEKLPKIGSYIQLDLEKIVHLKPDLCIAVKDGNPIQTIQRLYDLGIPVYAVNPVNIASIMDTVIKVGDLLNAEKRAKAIVSDMKSRIKKIKAVASGSPFKPKVFFQIGISPIVSAGTNTFANELIKYSGGINLGAGQDPYPRFSMEQIISMDPDIIIISSMKRTKNHKIFKRVKQEWKTWTMLSAVKNKKIYVVDSNIFDRPTPRLIDGLEILAHIIHPELFKQLP